jgi:murein endopeptidase
VAALVAVAAAAPLLLASRGAEPLVPLPAAEPAQVAQAPTSLVEVQAAVSVAPAPAAKPATDVAPVEEPTSPAIDWRESEAIGVPHDGRLVDGVGLPLEGPGWVTWDPVLHRVPNRANRLFGTDALVRLVLDVVGKYRAAHPDAPGVLIGDLSRRGGGEIDDHVSHENGLDVDVYYPRLDGRLRPPASVDQIDLRLAQDLLDRFVAAGVQVVFVGGSTSLRGPSGVVMSYPQHDNHMHVRIAAPAST